MSGPNSVGMKTEDVAAQIISVVEKGRKEIYIGAVNMLLWILWLAPTFGDNMIMHK